MSGSHRQGTQQMGERVEQLKNIKFTEKRKKEKNVSMTEFNGQIDQERSKESSSTVAMMKLFVLM